MKKAFQRRRRKVLEVSVHSFYRGNSRKLAHLVCQLCTHPHTLHTLNPQWIHLISINKSHQNYQCYLITQQLIQSVCIHGYSSCCRQQLLGLCCHAHWMSGRYQVRHQNRSFDCWDRGCWGGGNIKGTNITC